MNTESNLIRGVDNLVKIMVDSFYDSPYISLRGDRPKLWFGNQKRNPPSINIHRQTFNSQYLHYFIYESAWSEYRLKDDYLKSIGVLLND